MVTHLKENAIEVSCDTPGPRVLLACSIKSGSTYVSRILGRYLDVPVPDILDYYGYREQNLHDWNFTPEIGSRFVLQLHIKPYPPHVRLIEQHRMRVVHLWRNLGDAILSLDDHILKEHWETSSVFIDNEADYRVLPADERHRFLIRYALPWYVSFHLAWRGMGNPEWLIRCKYEDMVRNRSIFFARIIEHIQPACDLLRLQATLDATVDRARFNVGVAGRSIEGLSEGNKLLLERMLLEHPHDLTELLHELPWWPTNSQPAADRMYRQAFVPRL